MTKIIGQVDLVHDSTGKSEVADVLLGLHDRHIDDHEKLWRPQLWSAIQSTHARCKDENGDLDKQKFAAEIARQGIGDAKWDWRELHKFCMHDSKYDFIGVQCVGRTQGLMLLESEDHATRLPTIGRPLVYVERLAAAPWNRKSLAGTREFQGVGKLLVAAAVSVSIERKFDGRIGLHSLPGANSFYRDMCGMTDLGPDSMKGGLIYFEMTEQQARDFLLRKTVTRGSQ